MGRIKGLGFPAMVFVLLVLGFSPKAFALDSRLADLQTNSAAEEEVKSLVLELQKAHNSYSPQAVLAFYAAGARIMTRKGGQAVLVSKEDYASIVAANMKKMKQGRCVFQFGLPTKFVVRGSKAGMVVPMEYNCTGQQFWDVWVFRFVKTPSGWLIEHRRADKK